MEAIRMKSPYTPTQREIDEHSRHNLRLCTLSFLVPTLRSRARHNRTPLEATTSRQKRNDCRH